MSNTKELDDKYVAGTYGRFPLEIVSGEGSIAHGSDGKDYIDMEAGYGTNIFGFCDPEWTKAVTEQLGKLQHASNLYYTGPYAELAELLSKKTGLKKTFFTNSGGESNECAIKAARKYSSVKYGNDRYTIITMKNSFHGRSYGALTATGVEHYHEHFGPMVPGFAYADINDLEGLKKVIADEEADGHGICAIMFECVQGEGGVNVLDDDFVHGIADICDEKDILMICDEVQCGNGRTGDLYGYMHYGVSPDIVTTAKGLGGGLPIGACMFGEKTQNVLVPGDHGSTYGGNPVACAGALNVMSRLDDDFLAEVKAKSKYIFDEFEDAPGVAEITGRGLMIGITPEKKKASDIVNECLKNGVLCITAGENRVRLLPPLNIPDELLKKAVAVIKEAFA